MAGLWPHGADDSPVGFIAGVKGWFLLRGAGVTPTDILGRREEKKRVRGCRFRVSRSEL